MTDKEKLIKIKSLADKIYYVAFNLTTDGSMLRKAMEDYHQFIINEYHKEEAVSEDLDKAAHNNSVELLNDAHFMDNTETFGELLGKLQNLFKAGARWQKNYDKNKIFEAFCKVECNGCPPRSTCTSLGTCKKYDDFRKALEEED